LRYDDELSIDVTEVKDDVFMGYNADQEMKSNTIQFKVENEHIDQVVPTHHNDYTINCEDSSLDVIVLYVN
jgi:hypothetical protein